MRWHLNEGAYPHNADLVLGCLDGSKHLMVYNVLLRLELLQQFENCSVSLLSSEWILECRRTPLHLPAQESRKIPVQILI